MNTKAKRINEGLEAALAAGIKEEKKGGIALAVVIPAITVLLMTNDPDFSPREFCERIYEKAGLGSDGGSDPYNLLDEVYPGNSFF